MADSSYSDHCHERRTPQQTAADIGHDLQTLGLSYVDSMLMHWPGYTAVTSDVTLIQLYSIYFACLTYKI